MPTIGFLHTSPVHTATFDALVADHGAGVATLTVVNEDLLADARRLGPGHGDVLAGIDAELTRLQRAGATEVVCTCSTIGGEAERVGAGRGLAVVRVDRAMAEAAVAVGPRIAVVAAVDSTVAPTRALLESVAAARGVDLALTVMMSEGAWARFEAGDADGYQRAVAATCASLDGTVDVIVLAQASMADVVDRVDLTTPVLASPRLAVAAAIARLGGAGDPGQSAAGRG